MSYIRFTVEDFVLDKHFRQWVLSPNAKSNLFWQGWLERHPEKRGVLQEARAIILKMPRINYGWSDELEDSLWQSIAQDTQENHQAVDAAPVDAAPVDAAPVETANAKVVPLHAAAVLGSSTDEPQPRQWNYQAVGRVAATILLILSFGIAGYLGSHEDGKEQPVAYLTKEASLGSKARFDLPDGTSVVLNAGSTASYPERFTEKERLIEIKGEAFLEVAKDSLRPFRVKTGVVMTEAVGTAFNVRYEQKAVEIALVEGKVQVSLANAGKKEQKLILMPGEQAFLQDEKHLIKDAFDVEKVTAWKEGMIFFESAGEEEVISRLERWYGVQISTEGQVSKSWNFTGRFKDKSLEYVLKSVGYTMDFHFTIEKEKVKIIYP